MPTAAQKITPCLWFDTEAEDAAKFYCSVLKVSRITNISRYGNEGEDITGKEPGTSWSPPLSSTDSLSSH